MNTVPSGSENNRIYIEFAYDTTDTVCNVNAVSPFPTIFPNHAEVILGQENCPDFQDMYKYFAYGELPSCDKAARKILLDKDNYLMDNGALYHLYRPRTKKVDHCFAEIRLLVIPSDMRAMVAFGLHESDCHPGFQRVYATLILF